MSVKLMAAVWDHGPDNPTQRFVLLALADYADHDGSCYPSYNKTAQRCAISRSTAMRAIKRLAKDGWLTIETQTRNNGSHTSNRIFLNLDRLTGGSTTPPPSSTVTPGWYQDDTTLVADCDQGSSTVTPLDPLSDPLIDPSDDPGKRERPPVPPELRAWFQQHGIPDPKTTDDLTLVQSPTARLWLNVTMRWPGWSSLRQIVKSIGPQPDEAALRRVWEAWTLNDYSVRNVAGVLERYHAETDRGATQANGRGQPAPPKSVSTPAPGSQPLTW